MLRPQEVSVDSEGCLRKVFHQQEVKKFLHKSIDCINHPNEDQCRSPALSRIHMGSVGSTWGLWMTVTRAEKSGIREGAMM
jgi:hypothetical protein